jgi:uncharacterized protein YkwD
MTFLGLCAAGALFAQVMLLPPADIERALFDSINKERAARSLPAVRLSPTLSDLARKHSAEMARLGRLDHESEGGGFLNERLGKARIANVLNAENVAHSSSFDPGLIHQALMNSEGHRENFLLPGVDEVGIGVVRGPGGDYYVTQDFIRSVTWLDEAEVREAVLGVLDEVRRGRGLEPFVEFDEISRTARTFARLKAEGRALPPVPHEFGEAQVNFYAGVEIEGIAAKIREQSLDRYPMGGVGVLIAPSPGYPAGAYQVCTFLLTADPALLRDEPARIRAVLQTVNAVRADRGLKPFALDAGLSVKADDLGQRYRQNETASGRGAAVQNFGRLAGVPDVRSIVVIYETSDLGRLASELRSKITERVIPKVGVSVKPAGAGLTVNFVVVLLFED